MRSATTFQSSRYIDYDYDNECIVGFDTDEDDAHMIFASMKTTNLPLYPMQLSVELIGDRWWRKSKKTRQKRPKMQQTTPSPISPYINGLNEQQQYVQYVQHRKVDKFDKNATDKRVSLCISDQSVYHEDTLVRTDPYNGSLYTAHGTEHINGYFRWKFIMHKDSSMIFGLIDADIGGKQKVNIFANTESIFGAKHKGVVFEVIYDGMNGYLMVKNITNGAGDYGKKMVVCKGINNKKRYKLTVLLRKPSTITMF